MSWSQVIPVIRPELILISAACLLFLIGASSRLGARKIAPIIALLALAIVLVMELCNTATAFQVISDPSDAVRLGAFGRYIHILTAAVGIMLVLLAWPTDADAGGNSALRFGTDAAGEFFALLILSIAGIFLVAGANDLILLFLGIELASIPTYIMVSISRPLPVAQEAGVKYFFLGAMSAAVLLFGFSYLYGTSGLIELNSIAKQISLAMQTQHSGSVLTSWQMLAVVLVIAGLAFKIAAFPLQFYAGDVYEGAATPVTALLSFVPKTSGFVALVRILWAVSGGTWQVNPEIRELILILAALTMSIGNVLGLMQHNVKRVLAYSSISHTGYMLVGVSAMLSGQVEDGLAGVLFYLSAYGIMNVAAFGVLMLLPSRTGKPATSAETFEELAGAGRKHVALGLAMAVACFSLTGLPLTIGFFGKLYLIRPALAAGEYWLVIVLLINAAIGAAYYLRIVGVMFLRTESPAWDTATTPTIITSKPVRLAILLSTGLTLSLGIIFPATQLLRTRVVDSTMVDVTVDHPVMAASAAPVGR